MENQPRQPATALNQDDLRHFLLSHLHRIYCAKTQLVEKLPLLEKISHFLDLKQAIAETTEAVRMQIMRMKEIYIAMDAWYHPESCTGLLGLLDEAFQSTGVAGDSPALRDMSVLFYMYNIESIETASFKTMLLVADGLGLPEVSQLLLECYDDACEDKALFHEITAHYL
ncbi:DUF892 family protein [Mucilaginibacter corticis]|uniref:DUF892 family protein n=1 Tax=Mucilaginibacter corticis TaxID=2597670 RepID=A0A556M954_9SPHI|nr:DUF892 family protein [Mucilaginibacter corticis]TSJ36335.1 DUF892 family protein [Mucilaginibacter corticis]